MPRDSLLDFFTDFASLSQTFLIFDNGLRTQSLTYSEVANRACGFAARLHSEAIRPNDNIIFYSENRPEWIIALWGSLLAGVVAVPIDFRSSPEFVNRIRAIVNAKAILTGEEVDFPPGPGVWPITSLSETAAAPPARLNDVAEIIFTSGATADPKGVIITHRNILANIVPIEREVIKYLKWSRPFAPIRFLNLLPLSHMFGQAMATFIPPMLPGEVVFMRGLNPGRDHPPDPKPPHLRAGVRPEDPGGPARIPHPTPPGMAAA